MLQVVVQPVKRSMSRLHLDTVNQTSNVSAADETNTEPGTHILESTPIPEHNQHNKELITAESPELIYSFEEVSSSSSIGLLDHDTSTTTPMKDGKRCNKDPASDSKSCKVDCDGNWLKIDITN